MPWVPLHVRPAWWFLCFYRSSPTWWVQTYVPGKYKHVAAFGFIPSQRLWAFYGWTFRGTEFAVIPDQAADPAINTFCLNADVFEYLPELEAPEPRRPWWNPLNLCVTHISELTGIRSSALRPDGFLKDCLAHGAKLVEDVPNGQYAQAKGGGGKADHLSERR